MKYTILGTGAIGGYYGAKLQKSGLSVDFLARSDYRQIKENGLRIDSIDGNFILDKVNVYSSIHDMPETDVVMITMKTTSNERLTELLSPLVKKGTVIFVLQNGLGMEEELGKAFPEAIIMGGMCFICSEKQGPGHIAHLDKGSITAAPADTTYLPLLKEMQKDFITARIEMNIHENLLEARWRKLLWNIPFNGLTVALNTDTKEIMDSPHGSAMARHLMKEVQLGAAAFGCKIDDDAIDKMLEFTRVMTPYEPSMKLDFKFNRPMEIEYMYRRPLEEAEKKGVELPYIKMLTNQLTFIDER
jgi:2-dehydropantoate 2-reductase